MQKPWQVSKVGYRPSGEKDSETINEHFMTKTEVKGRIPLYPSVRAFCEDLVKGEPEKVRMTVTVTIEPVK